MSIETEIKQRAAFTSPFHKVMVNLIYTNNWITSRNSEDLKPFGLTIQQFNVLRILRGQHPNAITVNAIIDRMLDKMSNASRLVDKLLAKGLVSRLVCPNDRRAVDVRITDKGLALLSEIDKGMSGWESEITGRLTVEEAELLSHLLDKMRGNSTSTDCDGNEVVPEHESVN
ncbi:MULTISPECIES: MarR family winged helix-turn-helix transcriptional regulator [unclassified Siphonobacter]|uniref:MarR family winged helix-turn-helix transcriptional regulator n=1 Tax=unclassified Siphonobacter TaxID=2635712 RepID=UPI000CC03BB9|nr:MULTISPECIES: MarR family transcriptional regulator [unclassified Siphonobacter]MDQ1088398.1 DNA-binding MarR family transcriptional regulator [Siphonobacter sp. SORGH_AS_1065]MDR6194539.1 DNA-binding MarR family transcriptional regulator [Siphonobacter sp. SORGH_AS_0500]PKK37819.1 MarR family transcriptional regulator [Siphonobacter sp. SORGH_AS_0500]